MEKPCFWLYTSEIAWRPSLAPRQMKKSFWTVAGAISIVAMGIFFRDLTRDQYTQPIHPGLSALEEINHDVREGLGSIKPDAKNISIPRSELLAIADYSREQDFRSAKLAAAGSALAFLMLVMAIIGFRQGRAASNQRIERPAA